MSIKKNAVVKNNAVGHVYISPCRALARKALVALEVVNQLNILAFLIEEGRYK